MIIDSPTAMQELGYQYAQRYHKILLHGDLGAGKTHFSKGFAQFFGIDPKDVTSPTYTYFNEYNKKVFHGDMYRIEDKTMLYTKGLLDCINEYDYIIIERPKYSELYADDSRTTITIQKIDETQRMVHVG